MFDAACGNERHPNGPWHPASPLAASWEWREVQEQARRRKLWGCGCAPIGRGITVDRRRGIRRWVMRSSWRLREYRRRGQTVIRATSRQYRLYYWLSQLTDDRPEVARRCSSTQKVLRWVLGSQHEVWACERFRATPVSVRRRLSA